MASSPRLYQGNKYAELLGSMPLAMMSNVPDLQAEADSVRGQASYLQDTAKGLMACADRIESLAQAQPDFRDLLDAANGGEV